jgi:histidyl-tRNA synthetase
MGLERLIELMRSQAEPQREVPHVYLVMAGEGTAPAGLVLAEKLRDGVSGLRIQSNLGGGSFKSQFKRADRSEAPLAMILGEDELTHRQVNIKHLRDNSPQEQVAFEDLESWFTQWLNT